jgi:uncharacterized protein
MRNRTGQPVRGSDFFDREAELRELWHLLERDSVLLLAPRRVGKTSLLLRLHDQPLAGWRCAYVDVMSAESEQRFVARLIARIYPLSPDKKVFRQLGDRLGALLERFEKLKAGPVEFDLSRAIGDDWQELGERTLGLLAALPHKTVLLVDEFPIFVRRLLRGEQGHERGQLLLDWFRSVRTELSGRTPEVRVLIAGSIGLDAVVSRAALSGSIADLVPFRLGPMATADADALLETLGEVEGLPLPPAVRERMLARLSFAVPFHVQLLFSQVARLARFHEREVTLELVDEAYARLLGPELRKELAHWEERLSASPWTPGERDLMEAILEAACKDPEGASAATLRQLRQTVDPRLDEVELVRSLEHDGYLVHEQGRWRFASALLRDWWRQWKVGAT